MTNKYRKLGVLLAILLMIVGIVMMFNKYNVYQENVDEANEKKLNQALAYFQVYLDDTIKVLKTFSEDEKVIDYYKEVTDEADLETHKYYNYVYESIKHIERSNELIDSVYASSNHVKSMIAVPYFDTSDYVATKSRWFNTPIVWNQTYAGIMYSNHSNNHGLKFSETIKDSSVHGVVAIDVNMEPVFDYLVGLGDIIILKDDDAYDLKTIDNSLYYWNNGQQLFDINYLSQNIYKYHEMTYLPEDTTELIYKNKKHNVTLGMEPITGYQIIILKDAALENKMITSSLLQTFFVFFVLSIIIIILGNRKDNNIRHKLYKEEV